MNIEKIIFFINIKLPSLNDNDKKNFFINLNNLYILKFF
jgi:hypothetical protein